MGPCNGCQNTPADRAKRQTLSVDSADAGLPSMSRWRCALRICSAFLTPNPSVNRIPVCSSVRPAHSGYVKKIQMRVNCACESASRLDDGGGRRGPYENETGVEAIGTRCADACDQAEISGAARREVNRARRKPRGDRHSRDDEIGGPLAGHCYRRANAANLESWDGKMSSVSAEGDRKRDSRMSSMVVYASVPSEGA